MSPAYSLKSAESWPKTPFIHNGNVKLRFVLLQDDEPESLLFSTYNPRTYIPSTLGITSQGKLELEHIDLAIVWSPNTTGTAKELVMQDDGNLVLYSDDDQVMWSTQPIA